MQYPSTAEGNRVGGYSAKALCPLHPEAVVSSPSDYEVSTEDTPNDEKDQMHGQV